MPKVSIVMPVYNVEKYIDASIQSVINQTYSDFELILVNDGSTDNSPQICDDYAEKYPNIRVIHTKNNNRAKARDTGIDAAVGEYLLFVDSDDTIKSNLLKDVVHSALKTGADVTIFGMHIITTIDGEPIGEDFRSFEPEFYSTRDEVEKNFVKMNEFLMWNHPVDKLIKRSLIVDNNIKGISFYDGVCEDTVFLLDMFPFVNSICVVEGCYYEYAIRNTQSTVAKYIPDRFSKLYGRLLKTKEIMDTIKLEYRNYDLLYKLLCDFVIWSYEFMFHKDCTLSYFERYKYIRDTFSIVKENKQFTNKAFEYYRRTDYYNKLSGSSRIVFKNLLNRNYFMAWIVHILALVRN